MKRAIDFLTELSLGGYAAAGGMALVLLFVWKVMTSWLHRRHQRAMAIAYRQQVVFGAWMEGVRRELARRGRGFDARADAFNWKLFFENGRTCAIAVEALLDDERREGPLDELSPDCSPRHAA